MDAEKAKFKKIAIPSSAPGGLKAKINTRFGRCDFFTIITLNGGLIEEVDILKNDAANAMGGAGPMATQLIANAGVEEVIGGNYGPNAANALNQGNIKTYGFLPGQMNLSVGELVVLHVDHKLPEINGSNVGSHTGMGGMKSGSGMGQGGGRGGGGGGGGGGGMGQGRGGL